MGKKRILIIYYSFSSQTRNLLQSFAKGLEEEGVEVVWQQLKPLKKLKFPLGSFLATMGMMVTSFFRKRMAIEPLEPVCFDNWQLIVLAGPTWSYSPSGPILSLFDTDRRLFNHQLVLPFISCRAYWRMHYWVLLRLLKKSQAKSISPIVFTHPIGEPWSTIGVFLKLAGKVPESGKSWLKKFYPKYGHSRNQVEEAQCVGHLIGKQIIGEKNLMDIDFPKPLRKTSAMRDDSIWKEDVNQR